ncbi:hypothetical protein ACQP2U_42930 (plasmid) [Nocardia sp. CA-084685]|uniref:hypothetical protein n=1 Tax=Nocardia sp. CA-084685 TaxID=3239970 RepID=UPI003D972E5D
MIIGRSWTGQTATDLQTALRLSNRAFSALLEVEQTTVARWRANPGSVPKAKSQHLLDDALQKADKPAQQRFAQLLTSRELDPPDPTSGRGSPGATEIDRARAEPDQMHSSCTKRQSTVDNFLDRHWTAESALRAIGAVAESDHMQRRQFLTLLGAELSAPAHQWLLAHPMGDLTSLTGTRVQISTVDEIDTITASLRRMDDQLGGGTLLTMVGTHLRNPLHLLRHGTYTDSVGRRLYSSAAELLRLGGWLAFDSGQHALAQRYWLAALRAAHTAGDNALAANTLGFMSCQAKDLNQRREATLLAESARAGYRGTSPRVNAILHLRAAEAYATEGSATETRRALDAAFTSLDTNPAAAEPDWSYWISQTQAHAQAGFCFTRLAQPSSARHHLQQALRLQDPTNTRETALRYTLLANTHLQEPDLDLDQALDYAGRAVDILADEVTSVRCVEHLVAIAQTCAEHRGRPAVRDLTDRVRSLRSLTAARTE